MMALRGQREGITAWRMRVLYTTISRREHQSNAAQLEGPDPPDVHLEAAARGRAGAKDVRHAEIQRIPPAFPLWNGKIQNASQTADARALTAGFLQNSRSFCAVASWAELTLISGGLYPPSSVSKSMAVLGSVETGGCEMPVLSGTSAMDVMQHRLGSIDR